MALWRLQSPPTHVVQVRATSGLSLLLALYSAPRGFSLGSPVFPSPQKINTCKFQFDRKHDLAENPLSGEWSFLGRYR